MRSLFVTGTDTGVGKTVAAAAVLALAVRRGLDVAPMKAVQTGCPRRGARLGAPDLDFALRMAGLHPAAADRVAMAPYRFPLAASPHLAAAHAGRRLSVAGLVRRFERLRARHAAVVVEGAGGVLVPLNGRATMRDLMAALGLPVLLVARTGLGTLNHTLLSLEALRAARLDILAVMLCDTAGGRPGLVERDNAIALRARAGVPVLGPLPFLPGLARPRFPAASFAAATAPAATACLRTLLA